MDSAKRHLPWLAAAALVLGAAQAQQPVQAQPNVVIVFTDDQGYGDLGSYGHPTLRTPNLDRLAAEGQRWTSFYAAPVCTPSRAQLMTGRLAIRSGVAGGVFHPPSTGGLQPQEVTIAEILKARGYATAMVGKWHLGHRPQYLPTNQGFESWFGIPYSNDMDLIDPARLPGDFYEVFTHPSIEYFQVPLMRDTEIIERPADQTTITRRYTDEAIEFIEANRDRPFFLYLAHSMPHMPLFRSAEFAGRSQRGIYGDVIEEIDFNVGRIVTALEALELDDNTLVVFLSDNGPWYPYREQAGSAGPLRGAKGTNWEGGVRVPAIFWGPGIVTPGVRTDIGSELDLLPTLAGLTGAEVPADLTLDGFDLSQTLTRGSPSPRDELFYYGSELVAVRKGPWKLFLEPPRQFGSGAVGSGGAAVPAAALPSGDLLLYNLDEDPAEQFDRSADRPGVVEELRDVAARHAEHVIPGADQLSAGLEGYFERFRR